MKALARHIERDAKPWRPRTLVRPKGRNLRCQHDRHVFTYHNRLSAPGWSARMRAILLDVAYSHRMPVKSMLSRVHRGPIVTARQEVMYRLLTSIGLSFCRIGKLFDRDHTTVIHGCRQHALRAGLPFAFTPRQHRPARSPILLALLRASDGEPVAFGTVIAKLYGDTPPTYSRNSIRDMVRRARQRGHRIVIEHGTITLIAGAQS